MPLDHYISQVHLKNFYSPKLGHLMYAIKKSNLNAFTPDAGSVCRIEAGSTTKFLKQPRLVEEFLKGIEPKYNKALAKLHDDNIDAECIYVIAGFVAYVLSCSPASMRIQSEPLRGVVKETARLLEKSGKIPPPPPALGGNSFYELLEKGEVLINIDPEFPQAYSISNILSVTKSFGNFKWDILHNPFKDSPFFTSDFPVAIEQTSIPAVLNRIVPLSPFLAIRIRPDRSIDEESTDFSFPLFQRIHHNLSLQKVKYINQLIVRCAETTVFYRDDFDWVKKFVEKNANYRIEPEVINIPVGSRNALVLVQHISKWNDN